MRVRRIGRLQAFWAYAGLIGCGGPPGAAVRASPEVSQTIPPVPADVAAQRLAYSSPNLLEGDTSFELPSGSYLIEVLDRSEGGGSERPVRLRRRPVAMLAVHGQRALRLASPARCCEYAVRWPAVQLIPGQRYTFSVYLRSSSGGVRVRLVCRPAPAGVRAEEFVPGASWLRYWSSFVVPGSTDPAEAVTAAPSIIVSAAKEDREGAASQEGSIDIDAVQLEAGEAPGPYRPQRAVDYGVVVAGRHGDDPAIPGRPLLLNGVVRNNASVPVRLQLIWQLADVLTGNRQVRSRQMALPPGRCQNAGMSFGPAVTGYYLLTTYVRGGPELGFSDQRELAVFDPPRGDSKGAGSFFALTWNGQDARESHGQDVRAAATGSRPSPASEPIFDRITTGWPRQVLWRWRDLETLPGVDDFRQADRVVDAMRAEGAEPVVCLCGPMPARPSGARNGTRRPAVIGEQDLAAPAWAVRSGAASSPHVDARQYRQFVFRTVAHFAGRIRYWQIPPVPVDGLLQWSRLFHEAVKLADPRAQVVGPSLEIVPDRARVRETPAFIAAGGIRDVDILLHATWMPAQAESPGTWQELDRSLSGVVQACIGAGRAGLPHWEFTAAWPDPNRTDIGARGIRLHRAVLLLKKHGVARWLIPEPPSPESPGGLGPPVEVTTLATMGDWLGPSTFRQERRMPNELVGLTFEGPRGAFAALVSTDEGSLPRSVLVSVPSGVRVTDLFGRTLTDGAEATTLTLTATPVYLWPTDGRADVLDGVSVPNPSQPQHSAP
jgi:hypothetical protein